MLVLSEYLYRPFSLSVPHRDMLYSTELILFFMYPTLIGLMFAGKLVVICLYPCFFNLIL